MDSIPDTLKYILLLLGAVIYLIFFSKSNRFSKEGETSREHDSLRESVNLADDIYAWFGKVVAVIIALWSIYELWHIYV